MLIGTNLFATRLVVAGALGALIIGAVELSELDYTSDVIAVLFALCGGLATQLEIISRTKLNLLLICSELIFAAIAGFIVHAMLLNRLDEPRIIWGTAAAVGALGSTFVRHYGRRYMGRWKMFSDSDNGKPKLP